MLSNTFTTGLLATLLAGGQLAAAHMQMDFPAPFRSKVNPFVGQNIDYSMTAPLSSDGSNYPCKGYHSDLGTDAGKPTATFAPGGTYNATISGGANHNGGSCQFSLSYDKGATFTVIESIIGGCPLQANYDFTIPSDAQTGEALFAWTWHNQVGNREMYMNCAAVTIAGSKKRAEINEKRAAAYSSRPQIFIANVGNGCGTEEGAPVQYPNPGPDVVGSGGATKPPTGSCAAAGGGGGAGSGSGSGSGEATTSAAAAPAPAPAPTTSTAAAPSDTTLPGGVFITLPSDGAGGGATPTTAEPAATTSATVATSAPAVSAPAASVVAPAPQVPTTLQTATKASSAAAPAGTGTGSGSGSGSSAGTYASGTACTTEGAWNCISGTSFQRCASGVWSVPIAMAAGTQCTPGESATFDMKAVAGRRVVRRKW
ncbi:hypothetical protein B0H66DRAFT_628488 [Apodospora peruviana]|uniref:Lytic polysaccharide monooxygenase n=1 Tax=Apodospora peruviana TaxID=516989 RepID=A0AAE0HYR2_9PEZI|nr:hypothetical protein B0H66DRAFT_628488 [Apodospora peruviana]